MRAPQMSPVLRRAGKLNFPLRADRLGYLTLVNITWRCLLAEGAGELTVQIHSLFCFYLISDDFLFQRACRSAHGHGESRLRASLPSIGNVCSSGTQN